METVIVILFGFGCFFGGVYSSNNFDGWLSKKVEPHTKRQRESEIRSRHWKRCKIQ